MRRDGFPPGVTYVEGLRDVQDGLEPLPEGVSLAEVNAVLEAYSSCFTAKTNSTNSATEAEELLLQEYFEFSDRFTELLLEGEANEPSVLEAFREFYQCVTDRGWTLRLTSDSGVPYTDDGPFFGAVDIATFAALDRGGESAAIDAQIDAAADYAACMVPVEQVRQPIRTAIRDEYIDQNFAYFIEMEAAFRRR